MGERCLNASSSTAGVSTGEHGSVGVCTAPAWTPPRRQRPELARTAMPTAAPALRCPRQHQHRGAGAEPKAQPVLPRAARRRFTWREVQYFVPLGPITARWGMSFELEGKEAGDELCVV